MRPDQTYSSPDHYETDRRLTQTAHDLGRTAEYLRLNLELLVRLQPSAANLPTVELARELLSELNFKYDAKGK